MKNSHAAALAATVAVAGIAAGHWWASGQPHESPAAAASAAASAPRKVLYYRNPMGLPDTSPTPKKDSMGMDYIPVYEGEQQAPAGQVVMGPDKVQKLGVRVEAAALRPLGRTIRASGRVEPDERRVYSVSAKFEGYVERLDVNATGQPVGKGQPLFEVYSPELVSAQREYAIAAQGMKTLSGEAAAGMRQLADSALARLRNWDMSQEQVEALARSGEARRTVTFRSPVGGIVTEKKALQGMRFMPGEMLYQVTDLGAVWVIADVNEQDIAFARPGARASVKINAYPERKFSGVVTYVYPTLRPETRTIPVRVELPNPGHLLKPAMFAQVELAAGDAKPVLTVPESAVIDSGTRRIVLVQPQPGRFEPREVKTGSRSENFVEILEGIGAGEQVVVSANFLIDAESNLRAAIGGMGSSSPASVGHKAEATVDSIDLQAGTLTLNHGPVATLKWPPMTMEFQAANASLLKGLKPGAKVQFEFVERKPGEWVVTAIRPA